MVEWFNPERGYYRAKYRNKILEVIRNPDAADNRRYIVKIDGVICPRPCHTIPQAKTKAMKWAEHPGLYDPVGPAAEPKSKDMNGNGAVVPYEEPGQPAVSNNSERMTIRIYGTIPADPFAHSIDHLKATVDMLRDIGANIECEIDPPPKVRL
jgi:hypothetical protein